jgi:hypothetical protein
LKKVNFLLRVDELSGCELPTVPECVIAAKRAELQRRHLTPVQDMDEFMEDDPGAFVGGPLGHMASSPSAPMRCHCAEVDEEGTDMDDDISSAGACASTDKQNLSPSLAANLRDFGQPARLRCCGPITQPNMNEEALGIDDELDEGLRTMTMR